MKSASAMKRKIAWQLLESISGSAIRKNDNTPLLLLRNSFLSMLYFQLIPTGKFDRRGHLYWVYISK